MSIKVALEDLSKEHADGKTAALEANTADKKIQAILRIQYIVNDLISTVDQEITDVKAEIDDLSQPIEDSVFKQKHEEMQQEQSKLEEMQEIKSQIAGLNHYKLEIESLEDTLNTLTKDLKKAGNEGYTNAQYKALVSELDTLKQNHKKCENEYEEQRRIRDETQENISNLQFEANNLRERKLKITQTNASLVESVKVMHSMESDISSLSSEISQRVENLDKIKTSIRQKVEQKEAVMKEISESKLKTESRWANISEPYFESGRLIKAIKNDKIDQDEISIVQVQIKEILASEKSHTQVIDTLEKKLEEIKKEIIDISGGDKRVELLRKGKQLHEEIGKIKQNLADKCKHEDDIKNIREQKMVLNESLEKIKDTYNQTSGYNIRLTDDLRSINFDLKNSKYKDITKNLTNFEVSHSLAKLMAQEASE